METKELLQMVIDRNASDLHLLAKMPPILRINGELKSLVTVGVFSTEDVEKFIISVLSEEQKELLFANRELDFSVSLSLSGSQEVRFRVNAYFQRGSLAGSFRCVDNKIKTLEELGLPRILHRFSTLNQGFILVTGPTGQGKSTTLSAIINEINLTRSVHIVTIEDPIEYVYPQGKAIISQREMKLDTHSFEMALRSVLREDPNVVLIGEMRDYETISAALTVAETGHLVFATLHTNSAAQTIDRIVDVFPSNQQPQIRLQLSMSLEGIVCQKLLPSLSGSRVPAYEVLMASSSIRSIIREGKTFLIDNVIQTSGDQGMISFEACLRDLIKAGKISPQVAEEHSIRPEALLRLLQER
ncbi:MAG: twitching motility protein [Candidatus Gottesmanbacteria bacterium GW2011_GWC2_39_8]|uniref:Twitching motility protein n=1 Tax=Candidatus Gottesmanbacteria bacterium GW2011_GWC2_39_8 TaxID=1618450 RepID=A0A0G0Q2Z5_9BACT|nr:MAG: twitching motility protein [Candidatus Gottesmanbacteria bacterium GW2011_GWC2_39_8]